MIFRDRAEAGRLLGRELGEFANRPDVLVLALPRGGVPVAFEVARALNAPLDVFVVRKLGVPGQEELAMGAIASGGVLVTNEEVVRALGISKEQIEDVAAREMRELERREFRYRGAREPLMAAGRIVILVDDGLATGSSMRAAVAALRQQGPRQLVVAVPVGAQSTGEALRRQVDRLVCLEQPMDFHAVGQWYEDFSQTSDEDVKRLLDEAAKAPAQRED